MIDDEQIQAVNEWKTTDGRAISVSKSLKK